MDKNTPTNRNIANIFIIIYYECNLILHNVSLFNLILKSNILFLIANTKKIKL